MGTWEMLMLTGEGPPALARSANILDSAMEPETEFGPNPLENLLGVASVVFRDLEEAGFTSEEIDRVARYVLTFAATAKGGRS